jgi:diaminopimelate epimerase
MTDFKFDKYEGLGNDFILLEAASRTAIDAQLARRLCDRHFGVGADGVLLVTPASSEQARARMTVFNADGSRAQMCGNGLRCVALALARQDAATEIRYVVETDAGLLPCEGEREADVAQVCIEMGVGRQVGDHVAYFDRKEHRFTRISMGNPHAVTFDVKLSPEEIDRFSPQVSAAFPEGCNVEFATVQDEHTVDLTVWERGVGRTLACGTGAAATVLAAALAKRVPFEQAVEVRLPGGPLQIWVESETLAVRLCGPARRVYSGEVAGW